MLRVAVCWSGLTRDVSEVTAHNKTLFDAAGADITFDHFCQFWSTDNKFPFKLDASIIDQIGDFIPVESVNNVSRIIDTLGPKLTITSNFKDMCAKASSSVDDNDDCFLGRYKQLFDLTITNGRFLNVDDFRRFVHLHGRYIGLVNKLSQFYAFEQSVKLVEKYSKSEKFNYDVVLRMRYDAALIPDKVHSNLLYDLKEQLHRSFINNCMIVRHFTEEFSIDSPYDKSIVDYVLNQKIKNNNIYGVVDWIFFGSSASMYKLANNLFKNVSAEFGHMGNVTNPNYWSSAEILWFNEIHKKHIPCVQSNFNRSVIIRDSELFNKLKLVNYDVGEFEKIRTDDTKVSVLPNFDNSWIQRFIDLHFG